MTLEKAKSQALKYLAYRPRTTQEVINYLEKKHYNKQLIQEVINYLIALSYLDDDKFCQLWIESRCRLKPKGRKVLFYELKNKGIDSTLIEKNLTEKFTPEKELEIAKELIIKKFSSNNGFYPGEKIMAYLSRKGFCNSIIYQAVKELEIPYSN